MAESRVTASLRAGKRSARLGDGLSAADPWLEEGSAGEACAGEPSSARWISLAPGRFNNMQRNARIATIMRRIGFLSIGNRKTCLSSPTLCALFRQEGAEGVEEFRWSHSPR